MSRVAKSGDSSRSQDMVGTPTKVVTRSRSISSSARSGFHLYIITSLLPPSERAEHHRHQPVTWNSGTTRMKEVGYGFGVASSARGRRVMMPFDDGAAGEGHQRAAARRGGSTPRPSGWPVVPDV